MRLRAGVALVALALALAACGCDAGQPSPPRVVQVPQFGNLAWTWSGFEYPPSGKCGGQQCVARRSVSPALPQRDRDAQKPM